MVLNLIDYRRVGYRVFGIVIIIEFFIYYFIDEIFFVVFFKFRYIDSEIESKVEEFRNIFFE